MPEVLLLSAPSSGIANVAPRDTNTWLWKDQTIWSQPNLGNTIYAPYGPIAFGGLLWVLGIYASDGSTSTTSYPSIQAYDPASGTTTTVASNTIYPLSFAGFAQPLPDTVVWYGGMQNSGTIETTTQGMLVPAASTPTLATLAAMPTALNAMGSAATGGLAYAVGGSASIGDNLTSASDTLYAYNPVTNTWSTMAAPPLGVALPQSTAAWGLVWQIEGYTPSGFVYSVYAYNPLANAWSSAASPNGYANKGGICGYAGGLLYSALPPDTYAVVTLAGPTAGWQTDTLSYPGWTNATNGQGFVDLAGVIFAVGNGEYSVISAAWADARPYPSTTPVAGTMAYVQAAGGESALFWGAKDPSGAVVWRKLDQSGPTAVT